MKKYKTDRRGRAVIFNGYNCSGAFDEQEMCLYDVKFLFLFYFILWNILYPLTCIGLFHRGCGAHALY